VTVAVSVSGDSSSFTGVAIAGQNPIGVTQLLSAPPYQFVIQIPANIPPGAYTLSAVGGTASGQIIYSAPVSIDVERSDAPLSLTVQPTMLQMAIGNSTGLRVLGKYGDGSTVDLTGSSSTSYASNDPDGSHCKHQGVDYGRWTRVHPDHN
jgi:hypothetical protein